jgi:hypothetical protein
VNTVRGRFGLPMLARRRPSASAAPRPAAAAPAAPPKPPATIDSVCERLPIGLKDSARWMLEGIRDPAQRAAECAAAEGLSADQLKAAVQLQIPPTKFAAESAAGAA